MSRDNAHRCQPDPQDVSRHSPMAHHARSSPPSGLHKLEPFVLCCLEEEAGRLIYMFNQELTPVLPDVETAQEGPRARGHMGRASWRPWGQPRGERGPVGTHD